MASRQAIVLTHKDDVHVPLVQRHLAEKLIIVDRSEVDENSATTILLNSSRHEFEITHKGILLDNVEAVWLRKPLPMENLELPLSKYYSRYAKFALRQFSHLMYSQFPDAVWVSDYHAVSRASDKSLQLRLASKLGFNVPDTIFTSSERAAQHFIAGHHKTVTKPIECEGLIRDDKFYFFYTTEVTKDTDLSGLHLAPAIFQEAIEDAIDIRVTVVGDKVFAASISGGSMDDPESSIRDWRVTNHDDSAVYKAINLPLSVSDMCVKLVANLGLKYGAVDLVKDSNDKYWFLENNPNGQWAFVENKTGQSIGKAIADMLVSAK